MSEETGDIYATSVVPNMATTTSEILLARAIPERYTKGEDVELFITKCKRFFELTNTRESMKAILVKTLLDDESIKIYEEVDVNIKNFDDKLRKAFAKKTSRFEDMVEILNYRRGSESLEDYFKNIKKFAAKLASYKWNEEELEKEILLHCLDDKEIIKEVEMRDKKEMGDIKETMKKMDTIQKKYDKINAMGEDKTVKMRYTEEYRPYARRSYSNVLQSHPPNKRQPPETGHLTRQSPRETRQCWTCNSTSHLSKNCPTRKTQICYGCGRTGHIRRNCLIKCSRCGTNGHNTNDCYTNLTRRRETPWYRESELNTRPMYSNRDRRKNFTNESNRHRQNEEMYNSGRRYPETDYERGLRRGKEIALIEMEEARNDDRDTDSPNGHGPTGEESIGAMQ